MIKWNETIISKMIVGLVFIVGIIGISIMLLETINVNNDASGQVIKISSTSTKVNKELSFNTDTDGDGLLNKVDNAHPDLAVSSATLKLDLLGDGSNEKNWEDADDFSWVTVEEESGVKYVSFNNDHYLTYADEKYSSDGEITEGTFDLDHWFVMQIKVRTATEGLDRTGVFAAKILEPDVCKKPYNAFVFRQFTEGGYQLGITSYYDGYDDTRYMTPTWYTDAGKQKTDWTYVTAVWDGTQIYLYQDGTLITEPKEITERTAITTVGPLVIGKTPCKNTYFEGDIADFKIWGE